MAIGDEMPIWCKKPIQRTERILGLGYPERLLLYREEITVLGDLTDTS